MIEQLLSSLDTRTASFWGTHGGAELDLLVSIAGRRYDFECKYSDAPGTTRAMRVAISDLRLAHWWVVYPGHERYKLDDDITALPANQLSQHVQQLAC